MRLLGWSLLLAASAAASPLSLGALAPRFYEDPVTNATIIEIRDDEGVVLNLCAIASAITGLIIAGNGAWSNTIAEKNYQLNLANSCSTVTVTQTVTQTSVTETVYVQIAPYTTGSNCKTTATLANMENAYTSAVNQLHQAGAAGGCCTFSHGGTWHTHTKFKTVASASFDDISYPTTA